jgi:hypothetical protein
MHFTSYAGGKVESLIYSITLILINDLKMLELIAKEFDEFYITFCRIMHII